MRLYTGIDLHSSNSYLAIIDETGKQVFKKKLPNDPEQILSALTPYKNAIIGIVIESTYNWYWLVDTLMAEGYKVHLANPTEIKQYKGLKYSDDQHDAFWLAEMLRLGILPEGYIYPKEDRPIRDLMRKRSHLVKLRTSLIISLQNIICRNSGFRLKTNDVKALNTDRVAPFLEQNEDLAFAGKISKESIDFLTRQIKAVENVIEARMELREPYKNLLTLQGVGKTLGLTIILETGPISRFAQVGNYCSYCRKVSTKWISNDKKKGKGNKKSGNKYLAWAFSEAAEIARRYYPEARAFYQRKMQKTNAMIAHQSLITQASTGSVLHHERWSVLYAGEALYTMKVHRLVGTVNLLRVGKTTRPDW